jgi:SAM-dependent methyltransferase
VNNVDERIAEARAWYARALPAGGPAAFLEPRRDTCPWCGSPDLRVRLHGRDLIQRKPGRFTVEQCRSCGHAFQNPRLNLAGLDFYYRDFYDGLGAEVSESVFALSAEDNRRRAHAVAAHVQPKNWLDVGTGHGHFAHYAKEVLPDTIFDGLDLSAGVEEAVRHGRIRTGHRGLFPDLAPSIAGGYDVVSMHHYLEHTRDPRADLDALALVVRDGGYAEIEMPDVSCRLGRALGSWWVPWFQPQHQHFLPVSNLLGALVERGFRPVTVQRHDAHSPVDLTWAITFAISKWAPDPRSPWHREQSAQWRKRRHELAWSKVFPRAAKLSHGLDVAIDRVLARLDVGNAYRVIARKEAR